MGAVEYHYGKFPPANLDWVRLLPLIEPAMAAVARYEGVLHAIPNTDVLLSPLTVQEAVLSSKIEGTQATLGEVLEFEASEDTATGEKRDDIQEVLNYRKALRHAVDRMKDLPLSQRLIRETHGVLMDGVRGQGKTPGEFRRIPNWIGPAGCTAETARFLPPTADRLPELMTEWEKYLHSAAPTKLVQLAVLHAEFESIHPFLDGNGRLGRLLVPLFMVDKGMLSGPNFYVSGYLEASRETYYERLLAVSRDNDWTGWCEFFLQAITEQARSNEARARAIVELYQRKKDEIAAWTHSHHSVRALDWFFIRPIFKTPDFVESSGIPEPTAKRIVRLAHSRGLLRQVRKGKGRRPGIYAFPELLNIAEGREVF